MGTIVSASKKLAVGIALLVAGSAAAFAFAHHAPSRQRAAMAAANQAAANQGPADDPAPPSLALFPEEVIETYELTFSTRVVTSTGQLMTSFQLGGPLKLSGMRVGKNAVVYCEYAGNLSVDAGADANPEVSKQLEAAARQPFQLEFAADGGLKSASGLRGTPGFVGRIWTALGEYMQLTGLGGSSHWESQERDASGKYIASYDLLGEHEVSKRKLRYEQFFAKTLTGYEVLSSTGRFTLDVHGQLASVDLAEQTRAALAAGSPLPGFEGTTKLGLVRKSSEVGNAKRLLANEALPFDQMAHEQDSAARDEAMIAKMSLADALSQVRSFETTGGTDQAEKQRAGRAFAALTALLRRDPQALVAVRANLAKGGPATDTLLGALRDASTPETQKLLAQLSGPQSSLDSEQRMEAARCLSRVPTPTADTVHSLETLRSDATVGTQATFGLGTALHSLQSSDGALATEVRDTLTTQLSNAADPGSQAAVLTALGNAGDPTTFEAIRRYVSSPDPTVRAAAAQALRRISGPDADLLLATLCADPVANVRYSAADAAGERVSSVVLSSALSGLALKETALQVRAKAVNILALWYPTVPALAATLQAVAANDSNADLRNVAKNALAQG